MADNKPILHLTYKPFGVLRHINNTKQPISKTIQNSTNNEKEKEKK